MPQLVGVLDHTRGDVDTPDVAKVLGERPGKATEPAAESGLARLGEPQLARGDHQALNLDRARAPRDPSRRIACPAR